MSTSKISKSFNPKKAVNPNYGKVQQSKKKEVDKLEKAIDLLTKEVQLTSDLVKTQVETLELVYKKLQTLENRVDKLENKTEQTINKYCQEIKTTICNEVSSLKKEDEEVEKPRKSWFK